MISILFLLLGILIYKKKMKIKKNNYFTLDKFIEESLYNKKSGYYMKKNPFGKKGDF